MASTNCAATEGWRRLLGYTLPQRRRRDSGWTACTRKRCSLSGQHRGAAFRGSRTPGGVAGRAPAQRAHVRQCGGTIRPAVTLAVAAHLVASSKQEARWTYQGFPDHQPLPASWAETGLVMADEFRDGNVPAATGIKNLVDDSVRQPADTAHGQAWQVAVRSQYSASYEQANLDHWQARGWRFTVSADMSPQLKHRRWRRCRRRPGSRGNWRRRARCGSGPRSPRCPSRVPQQHDRQPYRYVAIRVRKAQGELFADGNTSKHFAVVTNDWDSRMAHTLLAWQRGKAGTIEHVHRRRRTNGGRKGIPVASSGRTRPGCGCSA